MEIEWPNVLHGEEDASPSSCMVPLIKENGALFIANDIGPSL